MRLLCFEDRRAPFVDIFRRSASAAGYALELDAAPADDAGFVQFRAVYRHLSINPRAFELACFRRYFAMRCRLAPAERAILADSDLIVQPGPLPAEIDDFDGLVASVGVRDGIAEEDVSPHFSVWTGAMLADFCDYLIHAYRERSDALAAIHRQRALSEGRASISDLTLIGLWSRARGIPLLSTNQSFDGVTIDHNITMTEGRNMRYATALGRKRIRFDGADAMFETAAGVPVRPLVIHLQGRYKLAARAIAARRPVQLALLSGAIAVARATRAIVPR